MKIQHNSGTTALLWGLESDDDRRWRMLPHALWHKHECIFPPSHIFDLSEPGLESIAWYITLQTLQSLTSVEADKWGSILSPTISWMSALCMIGLSCFHRIRCYTESCHVTPTAISCRCGFQVAIQLRSLQSSSHVMHQHLVNSKTCLHSCMKTQSDE